MDDKLFTGLCIGGPMQGEEGESRFPKGFVLVDKPNGLAWIYDWDSESETFQAREEVVYDPEKAFGAAEGIDYDVRALDA